MEKIEYMVVEQPPKQSSKTETQFLQSMGGLGWDNYHIIESYAVKMFYFKRLVKPVKVSKQRKQNVETS